MIQFHFLHSMIETNTSFQSLIKLYIISMQVLPRNLILLSLSVIVVGKRYNFTEKFSESFNNEKVNIFKCVSVQNDLWFEATYYCSKWPLGFFFRFVGENGLSCKGSQTMLFVYLSSTLRRSQSRGGSAAPLLLYYGQVPKNPELFQKVGWRGPLPLQ